MLRALTPGSILLSLSIAIGCGDSTEAPLGGQGGAGGGGAGAGVVGGEAQGGAGGQGGTAAEGGAASTTGSVEDDYCVPLAELVCARAAGCDCAEISPTGAFDEAACVAGYTAECLQAYAPIDMAVQQGLAIVDADRAAACIDLVSSSTPSCERPRGTVPLGLCDAWFYSVTPIGEACSFPICAGGDGYCPEGSCVARPAAQDPCQGYECAPGLLCLDGTCAPPGGGGALCDADEGCVPPLRCLAGQCAALAEATEACTATSDCAVGLGCSGDVCTSTDPVPCDGDDSCGNQESCIAIPRCALTSGEGGACVQDAHCDGGLYCDAGSCTALPADTEPCALGTLCAPGLGCTSDFGDCAPLPGDGEPCAFGPMGPSACAEGLGCNVSTCGPLPELDEPCTVDNRCAAPLGCDFTAQGSFCVEKKPIGGDCQNDQVCADGLHCDFNQGTCAADFALATPCSIGNECGPVAVCLPNGGGQYVCSPTPGLGDACQFDCEAGLACRVNPASAVCVSPICAEI